jgi:hypothetical protein
MGAVLVVKAITPEDLEGASFGEIPADLGGGRMGARNVPRGRDTVEGQRRRQWTPPSDEYRERMRGGGDVRHWEQGEGGAMSGRNPIPHVMADPDVGQDRQDQWSRRMARMGGSGGASMTGNPGLAERRLAAQEGSMGKVPSSFSRLMSASKRMGEGVGRNPTDEPIPRMMWGHTSDGAGGVETEPHERRNTELGGTLNRPGTGIVPGEVDSPPPGRSNQVRVTDSRPSEQVRSGAREHGRDPFAEADEPESSGNRRSE